MFVVPVLQDSMAMAKPALQDQKTVSRDDFMMEAEGGGVTKAALTRIR